MTEMIEDAELLKAYVHARSESAFAELVKRHIDLVYASAMRRLNGDAHLARDVTQMVFADLARKAGSLSDRAALAGWLYTSARYAASNLVRAEKRRRTREEEAIIMHEIETPASDGWEDLGPVIDGALDELKERDRTAVLLRFFEGRSLASVGAEMALSEDAARMRIERALEKLRVILARRGVTSTAGALGAILASQPLVAAPAGLVSAVAAAGASLPAAATFSLIHFLTGAKTLLSISGLAVVAALVAVTSAKHSSQAPAPKEEGLSAPRADAGTAGSQGSPALATLAQPTPSTTASSVIVAPRTGRPQMVPGTNRDDLAYRNRLARLARERLAETYGPLFGRLKLSDISIEKFKDLLIEKQQIKSDASSAARAKGGIQPDEEESFINIVAENQREIDAQIRDLLGAEGFTTYVNFEYEYPKRVTAERLREMLHRRDPLTETQFEQLVETMVKTAPPATPRKWTGLILEAGAGLVREPVKPINLATINAAKSFLSPAQWEALVELQQQIRLNRR